MGATAVGFLGLVVRPWHRSLPWERKDRTNVRKADLPKTREARSDRQLPFGLQPQTLLVTVLALQGGFFASSVHSWAVGVLWISSKLCQALHV